MLENRRSLRVEKEVKETLGNLILHGLKIPLPGLASVVDVKVSPDLRNARVYIKVSGSSEDLAEAEEILHEQRADIQRELGRSLSTKFCPVIRFVVGGATQEPPDEIEVMLANLRRPRLS